MINIYESLESAIEEVEKDEFDIYDDIDTEILNSEIPQSDKDEYGFFDPDQPQEHRHYDIGNDMGFEENYATEVDCSTTPIADEEYTKLMQTLNLRQSEICAHVMQWIQIKQTQFTFLLKVGQEFEKQRQEKPL